MPNGAQSWILINNMVKRHDMGKDSTEKMCLPIYENGYRRKKTNKNV